MSKNEGEEVTWEAFRALNGLGERHRLPVVGREGHRVSVEGAETGKRGAWDLRG